MDRNLKSKLDNYRNRTLQLIESLNNEAFDLFEELILKRQELIADMKLLNYTRTEFKACAEELNLIKLEEELNIILNQSKMDIKSEIYKINSSKDASRTYNKSFYNNSSIFSKKV